MRDLIGAVIDWPRQKADFAADGSLRDIYVQDATPDDWRRFVDLALALPGAQLLRAGSSTPAPAHVVSLFGDGYLMAFDVGPVGVTCQFFAETEIEVSFAPNGLTENALRALLEFMIEVGNATSKAVIMTPENVPELPIFKYSPGEQTLVWIPAGA